MSKRARAAAGGAARLKRAEPVRRHGIYSRDGLATVGWSGGGCVTNKLFLGRTYPRLQILTLAELFQGKKPDIPFVDPASVKRAKREEQDAGKQGNLL